MVCTHNKRKYQCVDCRGKGICQHHKRRYQCAKCGGKGICQHQRRRENCGLCPCIHKQNKQLCLECNPSKRKCQHHILKRNCRLCSPFNFCQFHGGVRKTHCKRCQGSQICQLHGKRKSTCKTCGSGSDLCLSPSCHFRANPNYQKYCRQCFVQHFPNHVITRRFKVKENAVVEFVNKTFPHFQWQHDKIIQGNLCVLIQNGNLIFSRWKQQKTTRSVSCSARSCCFH